MTETVDIDVLRAATDIIRSARQQLQALELNPRELVAQFLSGAAHHAVRHELSRKSVEADLGTAFDFAIELRKVGRRIQAKVTR